MINSRSIPPIARAFGALVIALACVAFGIQAAIGASAKELGKTKNTPSPNCPENRKVPPAQQTAKDVCQVTGQVTGFQRSASGEQGLFKIREGGKIVAWSVDLANPRKSEREAFGEASQTERFGKAPTAGISIIRDKPDSKFKLKSSSPLLNIRSFYGEKPVFTLERPLKVRKGDVVALTTATWLPSFSIKGQGPNDAWVASRNEKNCEVPDRVPAEKRLRYFFNHTSPHRRVGSERPYECKYESARLLYWAYFVPNNN